MASLNVTSSQRVQILYEVLTHYAIPEIIQSHCVFWCLSAPSLLIDAEG